MNACHVHPRMSKFSRRGLLVVAAWLAHSASASLGADGTAAKPSVTPPSSTEVSRTFAQGDPDAPSLRVSVTLDKAEMSVADQLNLRIDVDTPADRTLTEPKFDTAFEGWTVASSQTREAFDSLPVRRRVRHSIVLEPFLPGDKVVPAFAFSSASPGKTSDTARVKTEAIPVRVLSVLPKSSSESDPLAPPSAKPLQEMSLAETSNERLKWAFIGAGATFAISLIAFGILSWLRRPRPAPGAATIARTEIARIRGALASQHSPSEFRGSAALLGSNLRTLLALQLGRGDLAHTADELTRELARSEMLPQQACAEVGAILKDLDVLSFSSGPPEHTRVCELADRAQSLAAVLSPVAEVRA